MERNLYIITVFWMLSSVSVYAQNSDDEEKRYFVGSTLFMLANLIEDAEPPNYYQLNLGYRITPKDVISIEVITWDHYEPLGIPYHKKKNAPNFLGKIQAFGAGLAYKRFLWKRAYAQAHATILHQNYLDESDNRIQQGYQLFNTIRVGYQFRFLQNRVFLEPSIGLTFWPINTNLPDAFQLEENKWHNYFLGEPGLHFGYNF